MKTALLCYLHREVIRYSETISMARTIKDKLLDTLLMTAFWVVVGTLAIGWLFICGNLAKLIFRPYLVLLMAFTLFLLPIYSGSLINNYKTRKKNNDPPYIRWVIPIIIWLIAFVHTTLNHFFHLPHWFAHMFD